MYCVDGAGHSNVKEMQSDGRKEKFEVEMEVGVEAKVKRRRQCKDGTLDSGLCIERRAQREIPRQCSCDDEAVKS